MTAYYILSKEISESESRAKITGLIEFLEIQPIQKAHIKDSLSSGFNDLEDGVQHFCAASIPGIQGIITRNKKDFKKSQIPVFESWEVL